MLYEMLHLMWSYNFCASCFGVWVVVSDWEIGRIVMGVGDCVIILV